MRAYPQKQTVFILITCVLAVSGVAYYVFHVQGTQRAALASSFQPVEVTPKGSAGVITVDTDWRKQFLNATATATSSFTAPKNVAKQTPFISPTATYSLGQNFITQYALLRQSGQTEDTEAVTSSMNKVALQSVDSMEGPKAYTSANISVTSDTATARATYAQTINSVIDRYTSNGDEADIAATAFETGDVGHLTALDPIIATYRAMINALVAVHVPSTFAELHVNLLNGMSALAYSSEAFRHMDTDPVKGFAAIKIDALGSQAVNNMLRIISDGLTGSIPQR